MSSTLETTNNLINIKLQSLREITNILLGFHDEIYLMNINKISQELQIISNDYEMGSIKILSDYFLIIRKYQNSMAIDGGKDAHLKDVHLKDLYIKQRDTQFSKYQTFIKKENIVDKIDRYYKSLKNIVTIIIKSKNNFIKNDQDRIRSIFSTYENSTIIRHIPNISNNKCDKCSREMKIISNLSEILCTYCGITETLYGTVFEDEQFYYQEGQRTKHGSYDPSKHCRFWIDRLQAKETKEIPDTVLNSIRNYIKHNKIRNVTDITCKELREYLKQTHNSKYNEHIPLIRKLITGEAPAQLTDHELQLLTIYFDKVTRVYDDIKPVSKNNVSYHPYFIYKIIEHILIIKKPNEYRNSKKRLNSVLSCIHLQAQDTLIENDKIWKEICNEIDEIEYKPTDRNDQYDA